MVAQSNSKYITPEEYLRREAKAETKSEYVDGVIVGMAGSTRAHAEITFNLGAALAPHLKRSSCRGHSSDLRIRIESASSYFYPDLAIVCGKPQTEIMRGVESVLNPIAIFEVLSNPTERRDRGEKWLAYWEVESLMTYVLVHQDRPIVEVYRRSPGSSNEWVITLVQGVDATLSIPAINCEVPLAEIYEAVEFEPKSTRTR